MHHISSKTAVVQVPDAVVRGNYVQSLGQLLAVHDISLMVHTPIRLHKLLTTHTHTVDSALPYLVWPHDFIVLYTFISVTSFSLPFSDLSLVGLTWLTNHRPSVLWCCWLGHLTPKIVSEMTYNVSSGTLNPTVPIPCLQHTGTSRISLKPMKQTYQFTISPPPSFPCHPGV